MNFYENWVEYDLNPIFTFSQKGKILYSNQEGQFLLNTIKPKEIYDLALSHAPLSFGSKTTYVNLHLTHYTFYALTISYQCEEEIHIKLYKSAIVKKEKDVLTQKEKLNNIFTLIDLCINIKQTNKNITYSKDYDPSIPELRFKASEFLKLLNLIYDSIQEATLITTTVKLKTGEYIKINDKKVSLISIKITNNGRFQNFNSDLDLDTSSFILTSSTNKIVIDLPLLLK